MSRISVLWDRLRTGIWPVPLGMLLGGAFLFGLCLHIDRTTPAEDLLARWWLHKGDGDDARNLMSTLLTSIITMSSVVFSITIVALSLAANQFGSRLVRTYTADIQTKLALGLFTMTIVYCLLALALLQKDMRAAEVPHVTVTAGAVLALVCVLALLLFLHRVAKSVVADEAIRRVARELEESIAALPTLTRHAPEASGEAVLPADFSDRSEALATPGEGYIQAIAYERLAQIALAHDVLIRLDYRAGAYMADGATVGAVYPRERAHAELLHEIQRCILTGRWRTPTQDLEFSLRHLVDVALRALSPGINDANTALVVVDRLYGALAQLLGKQLPVRLHRDTSKALRVLGKSHTFGGVLDAALHQIRQAAAAQPAVIINLLTAIGRLAEHATLDEQRQALVRHAGLIATAGARATEDAADRADIQEAFADALSRLNCARNGAGALHAA